MRFWLLPLLSGVSLCLAFPDLSLFPLAWFALMPFLSFCVGSRSTGKMMLGHLLFCLTYFGGILYWIPSVLQVHGGLAWVWAMLALGLMVLVLTVFLLPFSLLTRWVWHQSDLIGAVAAPGFWILTEILRNFFPFGGFPWASLGYSQLPYIWLAQVSDLGGVYLLSYVVAFVNSSLFLAIRRRDKRYLIPAVLLFVICNIYGAYRWSQWSGASSETFRVGLAQADIALSSDAGHYAQKYFRVLPRLFDRAARQGVRWIVFPEAQNPYRFERDFYFRSFWSDRVQEADVYLLFNSTEFEDSAYFNSAHLLDPAGNRVFRYDKVHLVPFGEYLPLASLMGGAGALVAEVSSFAAGSEMEIGEIDGNRFATLICYEAIFPELSRRAVEEGAQILVNITNDGWFGDTSAPGQHLQMAAFRAIETRRFLLRAANSGYTAVISPRGDILYKTGLYREDLVVADVRSESSSTLFVRVGYIPCCVIIVASLVMTWLISRRPTEGA